MYKFNYYYNIERQIHQKKCVIPFVNDYISNLLTKSQHFVDPHNHPFDFQLSADSALFDSPRICR